jgi:hypothetical protein
MKWLPAVNLAAALFMTGLIWTIQIVHYPLFARVGEAQFAAYQGEHAARITFIVGPVMLLELAAAGALAFARPGGVPAWAAWASFALVGLIWASTVLLQIPRHSKLSTGFNTAAHAALVSTNWIRTWAWTARSALLLWVCFR